MQIFPTPKFIFYIFIKCYFYIIHSSIDEIGADVIEKFTPLASELIESKGAAHAVAALLAIATGQTTISNHSLITGKNVSKKTVIRAC